MKFLILSDRVSGVTCFYETKNELEEKYLFMAITLAGATRLVISNVPEVKESKGMQELDSVAELFAFVSDVALDRV